MLVTRIAAEVWRDDLYKTILHGQYSAGCGEDEDEGEERGGMRERENMRETRRRGDADHCGSGLLRPTSALSEAILLVSW